MPPARNLRPTINRVCGEVGAETFTSGAAKGHNLSKAEAKAATCTEAGNKEYWTCETCGKHFSDAEGKVEILLSDTVVAAKGHSYVDGKCSVCGAIDSGFQPVIIAGAGKAAALGGVVASHTPLPVIAVPMKTSDLGGMDSLLSTVQMPTGVPLACVAINGTKNAAILATQILGTAIPEYRDAIVAYKRELAGA